jgi:transposase
LLAHARTDTRWFHDWVYGKAQEIRFVRGRLKFGRRQTVRAIPLGRGHLQKAVRCVEREKAFAEAHFVCGTMNNLPLRMVF